MGTSSVSIYADGASRGNPGPAAAGAVVRDERGNTIARISRYLGVATNNQAEYQALIAALEVAVRLNPGHVAIYMDSELVIRQLRGIYKVRSPGLSPLFQRARQLIAQCGVVSLEHIRGQCNPEAHLLAQAALEGSR
jgi:ribonuclease HI